MFVLVLVPILLCNLDYQSLVVPIRRPFHRPNLLASKHLDLECVLVCPNLLVSCHLDRQWLAKQTKSKTIVSIRKSSDIVRFTYPFVPAVWFGCTWILDFLWCQEIPIIFQVTRFNFFVIDQHLVCVVWLDDQCVEMCEYIIFAADLLVDQMILALVAEDDMNFLSAWSAYIGSEHKKIGALAMHVLLVQRTIEDFQVTATTIDVLFMFHRELDNQRFVFVAEWFEFVRQSVETCIFGCL